MKKLLAITGFVCTMLAAHSQAPAIYSGAAQPPVKLQSHDTLTNTDTSTMQFLSMGSNLKTIQLSVNKISGTVSGKVYVKATVDGIVWSNIDSLSLTDVSAQTKVITVSHTTYNSYKTYITTSGTQSFDLYFTALRRPDEQY